MKKDNNYLQREIIGNTYLLPIGQKIADFKSGMCLNKTSSFLLKQLGEECDFETIVEVFKEEYDVSSMSDEQLRADISEIISGLQLNGCIVTDNTKEFFGCTGTCDYYRFGPLTVAVKGHKELVSNKFSEFKIDSGDYSDDSVDMESMADQSIILACGDPQEHTNGRVIVRNREVVIMDTEDRYVFLFPQTPEIYELWVDKDGKSAVCWFCCEDCSVEEVEEAVFQVLRFAFLVLAQQHNMYILHSASILYKDKAWLFSGSSGTGKSTHTMLWNRCYDAPLINGDLNMIGFDEGKPIVYGIPWCGTSQIYTSKTYPLGGIIFLKQASTDYVEYPEKDKSVVMFLQRIISPLWTEQLFDMSLSFAENLINNTNMYRLYCTKDDSAAYTMKTAIDNSML